MIVPEEYDFNRLPLGNAEFVDIREKNKVYVDKTDLIYKIARYDTPVFLSRPRRFGKSLLINTLSSLFTNGTEYFHGLKIEKCGMIRPIMLFILISHDLQVRLLKNSRVNLVISLLENSLS